MLSDEKNKTNYNGFTLQFGCMEHQSFRWQSAQLTALQFDRNMECG